MYYFMLKIYVQYFIFFMQCNSILHFLYSKESWVIWIFSTNHMCSFIFYKVFLLTPPTYFKISKGYFLLSYCLIILLHKSFFIIACIISCFKYMFNIFFYLCNVIRYFTFCIIKLLNRYVQ